MRPTVDMSWTAGDVCLGGGSTLQLEHELDVAAGAGSFNCSDATSFVDVRGTATVDVAGGARTWFARINNDGQVKLGAGTLTLANASANTDAGAWSVAGGAQLTSTSTLALAATGAIGGPGTFAVSAGATSAPDGATVNPAVLTVSGGSLTVDGGGALTLPQVNLTGGTLGGTRPRTITTLDATGGTLTGAQKTTVGTLNKSTTAQLTVNGGIFVDASAMTWSAGDICPQSGSTLRIGGTLQATTGTFNCSSNDSLVQAGSDGVPAVGAPSALPLQYESAPTGGCT